MKSFVVALMFFAALYFHAMPVTAGDEACIPGEKCYDSRSYDQYSCEDCYNFLKCVRDIDGYITTNNCANANYPCDAYHTCRSVCLNTYGSVGATCERQGPYLASCNTGFDKCELNWTSSNCSWEGADCATASTTKRLSCCGISGATPTPVPALPPGSTPAPTPVPQTCSLSLAGVTSMYIGESQPFTASPVLSPGGAVDRITFSISPTTPAHLTPTTVIADTSSPYSQSYTAQLVGNVTITATCYTTEDRDEMKGQDSINVAVIAPTTIVNANVYDATTAGCSPTTPVTFGGTLTLMRLSDSTQAEQTRSIFDSTVTFSGVISTAGEQYSLNLTDTPSTWLVDTACPNNATSRHWTFQITDPAAPFYSLNSVTQDFYFIQRHSAWWQAAGGDVYARFRNINTVPAGATNPFTTPDLSGLPDSSGVLIAGTSNSVDFSGPLDRAWKADGSIYNDASSQRYSYFTTLLEVGAMTENITSGSIDSLPSVASQTLTDGNQIHYRASDLTISSLTVPPNEKHTIFINNGLTGTVTIAGNITVPTSSFLAIITTGNIIFGPSVTDAQGIYLADGRVTVQDAAASLSNLGRQFNGNGIFVGWDGIELNRTLNTVSTDLYNNLNPAVRFTYRPDFIINAPDSFKYATVSWREVVPE
jgi:hypothetical protein